jgi:hypothetical protein
VSERLCIRQVVDGYEVDVGVTERGAIDVSANASETIDADLYSHSFQSLLNYQHIPRQS